MMTIVVVPVVRSMADNTASALTATESQNLSGAFDQAKKEKKDKVLPVRRPQDEAKPMPVYPGQPEPQPLTLTACRKQSSATLGCQGGSGIIVAQVLPQPIPLPLPKPKPEPPKPKCKTITRKWCVEVGTNGVCIKWGKETVEVCE